MWKKNAGMIAKKDPSKSYPSGTKIPKKKPKRDPAGNPRIGIPPLVKKIKKPAEDEEPCEDEDNDDDAVQEEEKEQSPENTVDDHIDRNQRMRRFSDNSLSEIITETQPKSVDPEK